MLEMFIFANMVWPSLFLASRLLAWWIVGIGVVIECLFVFWLTRRSLLRAAWMTIVMNVISTAIGILAIPISGVLWEFVASVTINPLFDWGTFNPVTWLISCILAILLNTLIEVASLCWLFKIPWSKRLFGGLVFAHFITVGLAFVSVMMRPPSP